MIMTNLESALAGIEQMTSKATEGPWRKCSAHDGKCSCTAIWSIPGDHPVLDVQIGEWGDTFPSLRFVDGGAEGSIRPHVEPYMEMMAYGKVAEEQGQANKDFIAASRTLIPALLKLAQKLIEQRDFEIQCSRLNYETRQLQLEAYNAELLPILANGREGR